ncbi:tRNA (adenosine(37)-N6)-threonylcarbamoyltransferase complex ATPase subunit type 1 TsaE [Aureimonas mangrovi]|uniref:tRNA (adenosine(37)-N6)-threonylcarbamoyltransferase complex ATPase subunit type 1 TsaE n=1 Tax=Aureimonas mangrovi TaxID=2758041 RepID=UPI00163DE161|nr:tRNA (adenosine(37)-N6)-threonylcarbamoyltransferase complex ATPase subunit type 1 TsaE [Aureimonas mangrovi]
MSTTRPADVFTDVFALDLPDDEASRVFAEDLAIILRVGDTVALSGDLGAGKTTLARSVLRYLADDDALEVPSPTYTLVQTYETRPKATHFDLYRIGSQDELEELGFEEAAETGIVLVEWPERVALVAAEANIHLHLDLAPGGGRRLVVRATAESMRRLSRSLSARRFLEAAGAGAATARRRPFPGDASARRYEHIQRDGEPSLVLMDAPRMPAGPPVRGSLSYAEIAHTALDILPFVAIAETLHAAGFSVPQVHASDITHGFVLLEDLGAEGIVDAEGRPIAERYEAVAECLADLHAADIAAELTTTAGEHHKVPFFDFEAMAIEVDLLPSWFLPRARGRRTHPQEAGAFAAEWRKLFEAIAGGETRLLLRDIHSPNILWQENRKGCRRIGILDFQDAMIGPTAYDLASLAQDARVDIPAALEADIVAAYHRSRADDPDFDAEAFSRDYAVMAAQRASKILGIFVRLHERDGKPQYLRHIPRIQGYLKRTLEHPALAGLKALYEGWGVFDPLP